MACECKNNEGKATDVCYGFCAPALKKIEKMNLANLEQMIKNIEIKLNEFYGVVPLQISEEYAKGFKDGFLSGFNNQ